MGARFGALVLDSLILAVPEVIVALLLGMFSSDNTHCTSTDYSVHCESGISGGKAAAFYLVVIVLQLGYFGWTKGIRGQSFGQMATHIRVVDANTGRPIGFGKAVGRHVIMILGGALCTIGYWSPFFDSVRRQGWHDKTVNSVVIPDNAH